MARVIFDIETGPLPDQWLGGLWQPPELPDAPGEFNPAAVKVGNLKDAAKIAEKIAAAKEAHERASYDHYEKVADLQDRSWVEFKSRAALSATTGRVLAIGVWVDGDDQIYHYDDMIDGERSVIEEFWRTISKIERSKRQVIGFNSHSFDLPFLIQRSWILGIEVPSWIRNGRYWDNSLVDIREQWTCGAFRSEPGATKLDTIAKAMGIGSKLEGVDGGDFSRLYFGTAEERQTALDYLRTDVLITAKLAIRMGYCVPGVRFDDESSSQESSEEAA